MKCLESTIPFALLAILALPVSCTSNPGTISGMTDAGTDADTDTDTDADTDTGTGADAEASMDAYFLLDAMRIGESSSGCDLDDDGKMDNQLGALITWLLNNELIDEHPNEALTEGIAEGDILGVVGLLDAESMVSSPEVTAAVYEAKVEMTDAGPPDDLFGGYGRVALVLPAHSKIEEATIVEGAVETPPASIDISIPLDDSTTMLTLHDGILKGDIDPIPDTEMLGGRLVGGMICGSVDRGVLGDVLADALELGPIMQGTLTAFLATIADIECSAGGCQRLSVGMPFSAVSVGVKDDDR